MKKLDTSPITDSASMPLKAGSLQFLQEAHQETTAAVVNSLLGFIPNPNNGYIIAGVKVTIAGALYTFTDGYIYFNGEIFKLNASSFTLVGGQQVWATITNMGYPTADPVLFGDNQARYVHLNRQMSFGSATSGDLLYSNVVRTGVWLTGDIKEIDCTVQYKTANFDSSGLGINERLGWAICNGANGTKDRRGRIGVAQSASGTFATLGNTGGEERHTLSENEMPSHTHHLPTSNFTREGGGSNTPVPWTGFDYANIDTLSAGGDLSHNNLQPYIVTLVIQKI